MQGRAQTTLRKHAASNPQRKKERRPLSVRWIFPLSISIAATRACCTPSGEIKEPPRRTWGTVGINDALVHFDVCAKLLKRPVQCQWPKPRVSVLRPHLQNVRTDRIARTSFSQVRTFSSLANEDEHSRRNERSSSVPPPPLKGGPTAVTRSELAQVPLVGSTALVHSTRRGSIVASHRRGLLQDRGQFPEVLIVSSHSYCRRRPFLSKLLVGSGLSSRFQSPPSPRLFPETSSSDPLLSQTRMRLVY